MAFKITQAKRKALKFKGAIAGPSGSGKTWSSLLLARGLVGEQGRIALADSEHDSALMYADLTPFSHISFDPPYSIDRYLEVMMLAQKEGFDALILDQISHAWSGQGGLLEGVNQRELSGKAPNKFAAWAWGTPKQIELIEGMLSFPGHLIATMRTKTEYVVERNESGKSVPRKVGTAPVQRDGMEYEFQVVIELDTDNKAIASKDRTGQISPLGVFTITTNTGKILAQYLDSGEALVDSGEKRINTLEVRELQNKAKDKGLSKAKFLAILEEVAGVSRPADLTEDQAVTVSAAIEASSN